MLLGVGEIAGALTMGWIIDKFGAIRGSYQNCLNILLMLDIMLINIHILRFDALTYLMTFTWGWLDGSLNIHVFQNLGF